MELENGSFFNVSCLNVDDFFPSVVNKPYIRWIFGIFYSSVWILGIYGNLLIFYSVGIRQVSLGVNSHLIFSLACSDLLIGFCSLPITGIGIFSRVWIFGRIACHAVPFVQGGSIFVSSFTLATIAIDRCRLVGAPVMYTPFRDKLIQISLIWGIGFLASVPMAIVQKFQNYNHTLALTAADGNETFVDVQICGNFCHENWQGLENLKKVYGTAVICVQLIIPLLILAFCYNRLRQELIRSTKRRMSYPTTMSESRRKSLRQRPQRTLRIVILVCLAFLCSWLPMDLFNLLRDYGQLSSVEITILFAVFHLIAMASIIWNPIIYCWMNHEFKAAFQSLLCCKFARNRQGPVDKFMSMTNMNSMNNHNSYTYQPIRGSGDGTLITANGHTADKCLPSPGSGLKPLLSKKLSDNLINGELYENKRALDTPDDVIDGNIGFVEDEQASFHELEVHHL